MEHLYSLFLLVLTTHLMLLINAVYQTAYTISRCMNRTHPLPIALSFGVSALIVATVGIVAVEPLQQTIPIVVEYLPLVGALLLFYFAYQAFKLANTPCACTHPPKKMDTMTIGAIFVMNLTSPHALVDVTLVSGFYQNFHSYYGAGNTAIVIVLAFGVSAFIWYGGVGTLAYTLGQKLQFAKIHTLLHWVSFVLLILIALAMLSEAYTDIHIFGEHGHGDGDGYDAHDNDQQTFDKV